MEASTSNVQRPSAANLSKAPAFDLGPLHAEPSARRLSAGKTSEILEPRAMRVLVALGETPGQVLSRDDLIELCWDGQIVGDAAINRAVALVRHALDTLGGGAVVLETITKVGFRIVVADNGAEPAAHTPWDQERLVPASARKPVWTRRAAALGVVAAGAGAALAYAAWLRPARHVPDPRAVELFNRGWRWKETGLLGSMRQAMTFWKQAVEIDPDYADAWGALAMGYRHGGDGFVDGPRDSFPRLVKSAADRALALDPEQPDALMALVTMYPDFGRWREHEAGLRRIVGLQPDAWHVWGLLDAVMQDVGRFEEGIAYRRRQLAIKPDLLIGPASLARGLHYAGRDHEADSVLDRAFARWPAHMILWVARWQVLIGEKRYAEAAAFARDPRSRPDEMPDDVVDTYSRSGEALATRTGIDSVLAEMRKTGPGRVVPLDTRALIAAELGDATLAFELLQAFFFGGTIGGRRIPAPGRVDPRETFKLFSPSLLALKDDPRHASLLERTGLEDYWRKSGTKPDFRKART